jgi:hypothetical protein
MRVPGKPPHLTLVTNTEELRQRIADKIPKRRRGRPRKPAPASDPAKSGIIEQCVIYAQSIAAFHAGFTVDHTDDNDFAGEFGGEFLDKARIALNRLCGLSPAFRSGSAPLASKELLAKATVLGLMGADSTNAQPAEMACYIRFFVREVEQYLEARASDPAAGEN